MSNGVFNSGDLSTAASRRLPVPVQPQNTNATSSSTHNAANNTSATASPPPLYARFRQSTSPFMADGNTSNSTPAAAVAASRPQIHSTASRSRSFLHLGTEGEDRSSKDAERTEQAGKEAVVSAPTDGRRHRVAIPSLTIKDTDDPFYRPNFEYSPAKELKDPMTDNAKAIDTVKKITTPSIKSQQSNPSQSQARIKTSSNTVGSRILSAFRSSTYSKGDTGVQVKSVLLHNGATSHTYPAVHPSGSDNSVKDKKTAVADIFPSVGSKASLFTASKELSDPPTPTINGPEEKKLLSDSGLGKSTNANEEKPAKPEEVLNRTQQSTKPVNATKLIAGEPPTTSGKALDRLIGIPSETPAKAISTLTGIHVVPNRPDSAAYGSRIADARQSVFSVRSETSTIATTYKEGKEDADESDVDTTVSILGPLLPGALPNGGSNNKSHVRPFATSNTSQWDRERQRKASAYSTSSDSSAAAVFHPSPPVPAVPTRILASGPNPLQGSNQSPLVRQAVGHGIRPNTGDSSLSSTWRHGSSGKDGTHDAMSSADEKGLRPGTGISVATFETALSHSDDHHFINEGQDTPAQSRSSEVGPRGVRLPNSVLVPRNKAQKPPTRPEKRLSKAVSEAPSTRSQQSAQSNATARDGPRKTLASLYIVAGLPKDPSNWALAENDADTGSGIASEAAHMENAVPRWFKAEVLGSMVSGGGEAAPEALEGFQGRNVHGLRNKHKKGKHAKVPNLPMTTIEEQPTLSKEETAKIQAKAIKLSMPRDVEIIAAGTAPPATSHTFSFTIKATSGNDCFNTGSIKGALGASWDMALAQAARPANTDRDDTTYYGASLIVWTHADKARTDAIRATIEVGSKARSLAIARAAKAAAAGRKFSERLARQQASGGPNGAARSRTTGGNVTSGGETEFETEVYLESEWEGRGSAPLNASASDLPFLRSSTFWLPYALTLISKYPIYDLMTDTLRLSWARYHLNITRHSLTMRKMLEIPAPRPSERFKIAVDPLADAEGAFVMRFPGKVSLNSITADIDFQIWPILRCLDADNLLRVAEIALSPFGRVVFFCQHVHMLNVAVETFRHLLEPRGWKGITHGIVHTRDIKVFIEDPGPFLIGIDSRCINIAREKVDPEICYVDLETNDLRCERPPPGSLLKGVQRERLVKRLSDAIGTVGYYGVPGELTDAFPGSRFWPFSQVEVNGRVAPAERLLPPSNWNYDQERFLSTFEAVISIRPNSNVFQRLLHFRNSVRKAAELSSNAQHVQQIVRSQSNNFVDKRDLMEAKLWRMNKRLALLMQESQSWNSQFTQFQGFTEKLSSEATDLRAKLERERREAKRLSGVISESRQAQEEISKKLSRAEEAHKEAMEELERIDEFRRELQEQRDIMFTEMARLAAAAEDADVLADIEHKIELKAETLSARSASAGFSSPGDRVSTRSSMALPRAPSKASMRSARASSLGPALPTAKGHALNRTRKISTASNGTTRTLTELREEGIEEASEAKDIAEELPEDLEEEGYLEAAAMRRMAITETMRSIQERLQNALASAQARARTASALPSPPPSSVEQLKHNQSKRSIASSPVPSSKSAGSPLLRPVSVETKRSESIEDKPRLPKKSKSRTVVGHLGTVRKVEVPSSASESEGD